MLVQVHTSYACAGIVFDERWVCVEAAPIFRWMVGKSSYAISRWKKIDKIILIPS